MAHDEFREIEPLFEEDFRNTAYYRDMKAQMEFLQSQLDKVSVIERERLADPLNSFQLQYFPVLTANGEQILFTKRDGVGNHDKEDIFMAFMAPDGGWTKPQSIADAINSPYNEGTCTITADGNILIYTSC